LPEGFVEERTGHEKQQPDPGGLPGGLLGGGDERRGEAAEGEGGCERSAYDRQAATPVCRLSMAAIFRHPAILRN
jgi:hypothetical protein